MTVPGPSLRAAADGGVEWMEASFPPVPGLGWGSLLFMRSLTRRFLVLFVELMGDVFHASLQIGGTPGLLPSQPGPRKLWEVGPCLRLPRRLLRPLAAPQVPGGWLWKLLEAVAGFPRAFG